MKNKGVEIADLSSTMLVSTFFFLWLAIYFSQQVEQTLAFILIFSFGILHGANDLEILSSKQSETDPKPSKRKLLLAYVGFVLASALLFYVFPVPALAFFILFSAYHFGEQHWVKRHGKYRILQIPMYVSYGLTILLLLFHAHRTEVANIIWEISAFRIDESWFGTGFLVTLAAFLLIMGANFYWSQLQRYMVKELFLLALFFVVFHSASLIWAFAIYFVVWHAIPSLADQIRILYGKISVQNGIRYMRSSAYYWIGALATLAGAFLYFKGNNFGFMPLFFAFLAAITFPHVLVILRLYKD
jgi:Brp/Blh family beta-carotene 15,15'-monooxygenase